MWYDYQPTKSPQAPRDVIQQAKYRGIIQTDGASGLDTLGLPDHVTHLGCWAHARRYVVDAVQLEISQRTYMDEDSFAWLPQRAQKLQVLIRRLLETTLA